MPDINSINKIEEAYFDSQLIHGPSESLSGDLIMAGGAISLSNDNSD